MDLRILLYRLNIMRSNILPEVLEKQIEKEYGVKIEVELEGTEEKL